MLLEPLLGQEQWDLGIHKSFPGDCAPNQASELGPQEHNTQHLTTFIMLLMKEHTSLEAIT